MIGTNKGYYKRMWDQLSSLTMRFGSE